MGKTEEAVRKTLAAVDAPLYDIGILSGRGMFPRMEALSASQCMNRLRYLQYRNANGAHIYFRPSGERSFTVLDDLDRAALRKLTAAGFGPCAVIETSPGNYQAWLRHTRVFPKELGTLAAQTLARRYGAEPGAADWRRFGRLPGFTTESRSIGTLTDSSRSFGFTATPAGSSPTPKPSSRSSKACRGHASSSGRRSVRTSGHGPDAHRASVSPGSARHPSTRADRLPQTWPSR